MRFQRNIILSIIFLFFTGLVWAQADFDEFLDIDRISPKVIVLKFPCLGMTNNIVAINTEKGIVVIDTHISPSIAAFLRGKIEEEFNRKDFAYVINTHGHPDHTLGNQAFPEAAIIGSEECAAGMEKNAPYIKGTIGYIEDTAQQLKANLEKKDSNSEEGRSLAKTLSLYKLTLQGLGEGFELKLPALTFNDRMSLDLGDLHIELLYFGHAHTPGDILIYCPEEGLLLTGDLFAQGSNLYLDSDRIRFLPRYLECLGRYLAPGKKINHIIPGHDEFLQPDLLSEQVDYIKVKQEEFKGKESALYILQTGYEKSGMKTAVSQLKDLAAQPEKFYLLHPELDQLGFRLMLKGKLEDALLLFQALAEFFPDSDITFDSLGELYLRKGENDAAIVCFEKSLKLNPENANAKAQLLKLREKIKEPLKNRPLHSVWI